MSYCYECRGSGQGLSGEKSICMTCKGSGSEKINTDNCEHDCKYVCSGCDRSFHDIKTEDGLNHDEVINESLQLNNGNHYCHSDCLRDSR